MQQWVGQRMCHAASKEMPQKSCLRSDPNDQEPGCAGAHHILF